MRVQPIAAVALGISIVALGYAGWVHHRVEKAMAQRERALVKKWAPRLKPIYRDLVAATNSISPEPQTLEELFEPLLRLAEQIGEPGTNTGPEHPSTNQLR